MKSGSDFIIIFYDKGKEIYRKSYSYLETISNNSFFHEITHFDQLQIINLTNVKIEVFNNTNTIGVLNENDKSVLCACTDSVINLNVVAHEGKFYLNFAQINDKLIKSDLETNIVTFVNVLNKFESVLINEGKSKNITFINSECKNFSYMANQFSCDLSKLLYSLNLVLNNLSYKNEKVLINKSIKSEKELKAKNEFVNDLINIDHQFAFANVKNYDINENRILINILTSNEIAIASLKKKLICLLNTISRLINTLSQNKKTSEKQFSWSTGLTKFLGNLEAIKKTLNEILSIFARFLDICVLINKELQLGENNKIDNFTISYGFKNNKTYYSFLKENNEVVGLPMSFDVLSLLLTYSEDKYKPTYIFDYLIGKGFIKLMADLNFINCDKNKKSVDFRDDITLKFTANKIDILVEYFVQKRRVNLAQDTQDYRPSFIISFLSKKQEILKTISIDSFKKNKDKFFKENNRLTDMDIDNDLIDLKKLKGIRLLIGDKIISDYFYFINKSAVKLEKIALYGFKNVGDYIENVEKVLNKIITPIIQNILVGDDLIN